MSMRTEGASGTGLATRAAVGQPGDLDRVGACPGPLPDGAFRNAVGHASNSPARTASTKACQAAEE